MTAGIRLRLLLSVCLAAAALAPGAAAGGPGGGVRIERGLQYEVVGGTSLLLDAYLPVRRSAPRPAIVFVHGGGWRSGDRTAFAPGEQAFAPTAVRLARLGFAVFSIDYRLAPAARFPASVDDVAGAVRWVRAHGVRLGVDPARLALFGASAGGNLAALAADRGRGRLDRGARVRAVVSWSGPMDLALFDAELGGPQAHPFVEGYVGCSPETCPARYRAASPVSAVDATDPPMLIANGTGEIVPPAQAREMAARLAAAGVPHTLLLVPGTEHAAQYEPAAWAATVGFLRRYLA
jgi:acetyl esterase/lipase